MERQLGFRDFTATRAVRTMAVEQDVQIIHGHGAKGGAYARLASSLLRKREPRILCFYTPHGGSLHYDTASRAGRIYFRLERWMGKHTDGLIFESAYSAGLYAEKIGNPPCEGFIIPNGLWPHEFYELRLDEDAADFLFVGELRHLKGVDILLQALGDLNKDRSVSAVIVGAGPDEAKFKRMAARLGLKSRVTFTGAMPASQAFSRGQCLVVPSRAESFPYIVLEAAAAQLPMILTDVGGIPEIVEGTPMHLIPPGDVEALKSRMKSFLENPADSIEVAKQLQSVVAEKFTATGMAQSVTEFYERVIFFEERK
jgi:glycosyltransferase involved in cell wall biosynthesis